MDLKTGKAGCRYSRGIADGLVLRLGKGDMRELRGCCQIRFQPCTFDELQGHSRFDSRPSSRRNTSSALAVNHTPDIATVQYTTAWNAKWAKPRSSRAASTTRSPPRMYTPNMLRRRSTKNATKLCLNERGPSVPARVANGNERLTNSPRRKKWPHAVPTQSRLSAAPRKRPHLRPRRLRAHERLRCRDPVHVP